MIDWYRLKEAVVQTFMGLAGFLAICLVVVLLLVCCATIILVIDRWPAVGIPCVFVAMFLVFVGLNYLELP